MTLVAVVVIAINPFASEAENAAGEFCSGDWNTGTSSDKVAQVENYYSSGTEGPC